MGIRNMNAAVLDELRQVTGSRSIRQKDIMEWQTGRKNDPPFLNRMKVGERYFYLPKLKVNVAVQGSAVKDARK